MKLKKIKNNLFISNFDHILENAEIIYFNKSSVEIPGKVIYTIPTNLILKQTLNPSVIVVSVQAEELKDMIEDIQKKQNGILFFQDDQLIPKKEVRLNLLKIRKNIILLEKEEGSVKINNDLIFTTSAFVYKTEGLLFNKKVFLLDKEDFNKISALLYNIS